MKKSPSIFNIFEGLVWEGACKDTQPKHITQNPLHNMAAQAREGQTVAARAMAQEAAASLRSTAVLSPMGIELGPDTLLGMRLVLLKLGDGPLSEFGQKVLIALLIAYSACTIKQS